MAPTHTLFAVYLGLMVLLAITCGSHFLELGHGNVAINLSVSAAKTSLIALFFMNLRHEKILVRSLSLAGLAWLLILFTLIVADYLHRGPGGSG